MLLVLYAKYTFAIQKMAGITQHIRGTARPEIMEIARQQLRSLFVSITNFRIVSCSEENDNRYIGGTFIPIINTSLQTECYWLD